MSRNRAARRANRQRLQLLRQLARSKREGCERLPARPNLGLDKVTVQDENDRGQDPPTTFGPPSVDERAHFLTVGRELDQRKDCEGKLN